MTQMIDQSDFAQMTSEQQNQPLNELLTLLMRSLLQYVHESWPWTDASTQETQQRITELVARQQENIGEIYELLWQREWPIEVGTFPDKFTDLHYVALSFLLSKLVESERSLAADIEAVIDACATDPEAYELLKRVRAHQQDRMAELEEIAKSNASGQTG